MEQFKEFCEAFKDYACPSKEAILKQCYRLTETLLRKNADYGNSATSEPIFSGISKLDALLVRKGDKIKRIKNLLQNELSSQVNEPLSETFLDDAGYDILINIVLEERNQQ